MNTDHFHRTHLANAAALITALATALAAVCAGCSQQQGVRAIVANAAAAKADVRQAESMVGQASDAAAASDVTYPAADVAVAATHTSEATGVIVQEPVMDDAGVAREMPQGKTIF